MSDIDVGLQIHESSEKFAVFFDPLIENILYVVVLELSSFLQRLCVEEVMTHANDCGIFGILTITNIVSSDKSLIKWYLDAICLII